MKNPIKMYMVFSPNGERQYQSLRYTAKQAKGDFVGESKDWHKWRDHGWHVRPVDVIVKLASK